MALTVDEQKRLAELEAKWGEVGLGVIGSKKSQSSAPLSATSQDVEIPKGGLLPGYDPNMPQDDGEGGGFWDKAKGVVKAGLESGAKDYGIASQMSGLGATALTTGLGIGQFLGEAGSGAIAGGAATLGALNPFAETKFSDILPSAGAGIEAFREASPIPKINEEIGKAYQGNKAFDVSQKVVSTAMKPFELTDEGLKNAAKAEAFYSENPQIVTQVREGKISGAVAKQLIEEWTKKNPDKLDKYTKKAEALNILGVMLGGEVAHGYLKRGMDAVDAKIEVPEYRGKIEIDPKGGISPETAPSTPPVNLTSKPEVPKAEVKHPDNSALVDVLISQKAQLENNANTKDAKATTRLLDRMIDVVTSSEVPVTVDSLKDLGLGVNGVRKLRGILKSVEESNKPEGLDVKVDKLKQVLKVLKEDPEGNKDAITLAEGKLEELNKQGEEVNGKQSEVQSTEESVVPETPPMGEPSPETDPNVTISPDPEPISPEVKSIEEPEPVPISETSPKVNPDIDIDLSKEGKDIEVKEFGSRYEAVQAGYSIVDSTSGSLNGFIERLKRGAKNDSILKLGKIGKDFVTLVMPADLLKFKDLHDSLMRDFEKFRSKAHSAKDVGNWLQKSDNPVYRAIGEIFSKSELANKVSMNNSTPPRYYPDLKVMSLGRLRDYNIKGTALGLSPERAAAHEILHAFTSDVINKYTSGIGYEDLNAEQIKACRKLDDIRLEVIEYLKTSEDAHLQADYGTFNLHEFVSEAFTNPDFQTVLMKIKGKSKRSTVWKRLVSAIRNMVGENISGTGLEDVIIYTHDILDSLVRSDAELGEKFDTGRETSLYPERDIKISEDLPAFHEVAESVDIGQLSKWKDEYARRGMQDEVNFIEQKIKDLSPVDPGLMKPEEELKIEEDGTPDPLNKSNAKAKEALKKLREKNKSKGKSGNDVSEDPRSGDFKYKKDAVAWKKAQGLTGEVAKNPESGRWEILPDTRREDGGGFEETWGNEDQDFIDSLTRGNEPDLFGDRVKEDDGEVSAFEGSRIADRQEPTKNSEPFSEVNPTYYDRKLITDVHEAAKRLEQGRNLIKLLKDDPTYLDRMEAEGFPKDVVDKLRDVARGIEDSKELLKEKDPILYDIFYPEDPVSKQRFTRFFGGRNKGKIALNVQVGRGLAELVSKAKIVPKFAMGRVGKALRFFDNRFPALRHYGLEGIFHDFLAKRTDMMNEKNVWERVAKEGNEYLKGFSKEEVENFFNWILKVQEGGEADLISRGIKPEDVIEPRAELIGKWQELRGIYDEFLERLNYVRSRTGAAPIRALPNYTRMAFNFKDLRSGGVNPSLLSMTESQIRQAFGKISDPNSTWRRRAKLGSGLEHELNPYTALMNYVDIVVQDLHTRPVAALAKELAVSRIKLSAEKGDRGFKLANTNPHLATLLSDWADEIMGDPLSKQWNQKMGDFSKGLHAINNNIVTYYLAWSISSILKQFSSYAGTVASVRPSNAVLGIFDMLGESKERTLRRSNTLMNSMSEQAIETLKEDLAKGNQGVFKNLAESGMAAIGFTDSMTRRATFFAGLREAKSRGITDPKAQMKYANELVIMSQGLGIRGAGSPFQNIPGALGRTLGILQSFQISNWNFVLQDILGVGNEKISRGDAIRLFTKYMIASALLNTVYRATKIGNALPDPVNAYQTEYDESHNGAKASAMAMLELGTVLPVVGNLKYGGGVGVLAKQAVTTPMELTKGNVASGSTAMLGAIGGALTGGNAGLGIQVGSALMANWMMNQDKSMSPKQRTMAKLTMYEMYAMAYGLPMGRQIKKSLRAHASENNSILGQVMGEVKRQNNRAFSLESNGLNAPSGLGELED